MFLRFVYYPKQFPDESNNLMRCQMTYIIVSLSTSIVTLVRLKKINYRCKWLKKSFSQKGRARMCLYDTSCAFTILY